LNGFEERLTLSVAADQGHGTKRNLTGAVESLEAAAKHQHPNALNTLGWHALEIEKNHSKAADLFQRSYALGNKDAAFNLAHMYLQGIYPGSGINRVSQPDSKCTPLG